MKLSVNGIKNHEEWEKAGIMLPGYDVEAVSAKAKEAPVWVHFGIGNIFRVFIGGIADGLLEEGVLDRGLTCVETFDYDVVDKIYKPYDNLGLSVILHGDGRRDYKVLGSLAEAVKAQASDAEQWNRLKEIFRSSSLQFPSQLLRKVMHSRKLTAHTSRLYRLIFRMDRTKQQEPWRFWYLCCLRDTRQADFLLRWFLWTIAHRMEPDFENPY